MNSIISYQKRKEKKKTNPSFRFIKLNNGHLPKRTKPDRAWNDPLMVGSLHIYFHTCEAARGQFSGPMAGLKDPHKKRWHLFVSSWEWGLLFGGKAGWGGHQACEVDALNGQLFRAPLKALVRVISDVVCIWTIILFNLKDPKVEPWPRQRWPFLAVDSHVTMANLVHLFWRPHMEPIWNIDPYLSY